MRVHFVRSKRAYIKMMEKVKVPLICYMDCAFYSRRFYILNIVFDGY